MIVTRRKAPDRTTPVARVGSIEVINPDTLVSEGILVKSADVGGIPAFDIEIPNVQKGYIIVTDPNFTVPDRCYAFDTQTGSLYETIVAESEQPFEFTQMATDSEGYLYLLRASLIEPEIIKIDTLTDQKVAVELKTNLPPVAIDILELH